MIDIKRYIRALQPPVFDDLHKSYISRILYRALWLSLFGVFPALLLGAQQSWQLIVALAFLGLLAILGALLRRGHIQLTAVLLVMGLWTLMTLDVLMVSGILGLGYMGYLLPIVIASFTLGWELGLGHALVCSFTGFVLLLTQDTTPSPVAEWYFYSFFFFSSVYIIYIIDKSWHKPHLWAEENAVQVMRPQIAGERDSASHDLPHHQELLQAFVHSLPDIAFIIDEEGRYIDVFGNQDNVVYGEPKEMIGLRFHEILPDSAVADKFLLMIRLALESNETQRIEYNLKTETGPRWFEGYISLMPNSVNQPRRVLWVSRDITERKQVEQNRLKTEKAYVKMESEKEIFALRHDFIASVSHEFRTPLAVILSSKEILDLYYDRMTPKQRSDHLQKIEDHVRFMVKMVDKLSFMNKASAGLLKVMPEPVALPELCQEMIDQAQMEATDQHDLILTMIEPPHLLYADMSLLRQMLSNLLSNAIKYSPQGGPVHFVVTQENGQVLFKIQDKGIGVLPDDIKRMFEPFFRGANVQDIAGTGLGLTIVEHAIELHHGTITCESRPNEGAIFMIHLPLDLRVKDA